MTPKIKLGKTSTSRTRAKAKEPVLSTEAIELKQQLEYGNLEFIDYLLAKGYSTTTISQYAKDVHRFEAWTEKENTPIESTNYNDILHYIQSKKTTISQRTVSHITNSLKHYFNFLIASGTVKDNPATSITIKGVRRKKLYDILTKPELEQLYDSYQPKEDRALENYNWYQKSLLSFKRNKVIIGLAVYQGLNATELQRLKEKDVKLREGKIFIAGTRKSNERELNLESVQILDLMEYTLKTRNEILQLTDKKSDKLLISTGKGHSLNNTFYKLSTKLQEINPKAKSLKQIRTSVITHWLKIHNLREVQYMAGHRYVSSTESYLINDLDGLQEDITKFHPIG